MPYSDPLSARTRGLGNNAEAQARSEMARSYFGYGDLYLRVAECADSVMEKKDNLSCARSWYEKSLQLWRGMQRDRVLHDHDAQYPEQASQKILKCDEALARLDLQPAAFSGGAN